MSSNYNQRGCFLFCILLVWLAVGCSKLVQVPDPVNTITTTETFSTDATAEAAIAGIYNDILSGHQGYGVNLSYGSGDITIDAGMSADELLINGSSPFVTNTLNSSNVPANIFWDDPYFDIYMANEAILSLPASTGVDSATRNELTGEAKFLRAFCYFYLVNLFGDVPLATTTEYLVTDTLHRSPTAQVYQLIIADLKDAQNLLPGDYSVGGGQRIRVNQFGAIALLARAYLYTGDYSDAQSAASTVINNSNLYSLETNLNAVFLDTSSEAILQWLSPDYYPYGTAEGNAFIPNSSTSEPQYYLTGSLLASFEPGDQRRTNWVDSTIYSGNLYYYPYKYKVKVGQNGNVTENYVVLRLAEQYLIRAEAEAEQGDSTDAINDLNIIRSRAQLPNYSLANQGPLLQAIFHERQIELFAEWGNRWFDLKRNGPAFATSVLSANKGLVVSSSQLLYPIPASELIDNANLVQNPGY
jgi:hypothetical protein